MRVHRVTPTRLALDPVGEFDLASRCEVGWTQSGVSERIRFTTGARALPAQIPYDREDLRQVAPYPDDFWLVANPLDPTEHRLRVQMSGFNRTARWLMNALVSGVREFDGFSPIAHITIPLSAPADPDSIPRTPEQSLDPLASIVLFDVTPGSADYASRIPFRLDARTEITRRYEEHALLLFPSVALKPGHRYGVIVTRRALSHTGASYDPSAFFETVRDESSGLDGSWAVKRAQKLVDGRRGVCRAFHGSQPRRNCGRPGCNSEADRGWASSCNRDHPGRSRALPRVTREWRRRGRSRHLDGSRLARLRSLAR
jgi:hypothetical protein